MGMTPGETLFFGVYAATALVYFLRLRELCKHVAQPQTIPRMKMLRGPNYHDAPAHSTVIDKYGRKHYIYCYFCGPGPRTVEQQRQCILYSDPDLKA